MKHWIVANSKTKQSPRMSLQGFESAAVQRLQGVDHPGWNRMQLDIE
jgi:hypothetical protein